ncbi:MAG TPA: amidohydrolase family protein [Acidothermaceae bacterium]
MTLEIVDAHHHLWDLRQHPQTWINPATEAAINRNFVVEDLKAAITPVEVIGTVVVQSIADADETTHLLERAADSNGLIAGVVGWADLTSSDLDERVSEWLERPDADRLVGFRHLVQSEQDDEWLLREDVRRGLAVVTRHGLTYDLLVKMPQLPAAVEIVRRCPETRFVLNHLAKPLFRTGDLDEWERLIRELAASPNVCAKVSGLVTEATSGEWTVDTFQRAVDVALEAFGADRLMFGSDWPVCLLEADYAAVVELADRLLAGQVTDAECRKIFVDNAVEFYGLRLRGAS